MKVCLIACLLSLIVHAPSAYAMVNGEAPDADEHRYDAVAAFARTRLLEEDDKDQHSNRWIGNGVLIAPDVVLVARHLLSKPIASGKNRGGGVYTVRFRRHKDGSLGSREGGPDSYHQVAIEQWVVAPHADLAMGMLRKPVEYIDPVKVLLDDTVKPEARRCVLAGWGSESPWRGKRWPRYGLRIGENTVTAINAHLRIDSYQTEPRIGDDGSRGVYIIDEHAVPNQHDSGGSIFLLDEAGKPTLAGLISSYTTGPFLPAATRDDFPIDAAVRGGRALTQALRERGGAE